MLTTSLLGLANVITVAMLLMVHKEQKEIKKCLNTD